MRLVHAVIPMFAALPFLLVACGTSESESATHPIPTVTVSLAPRAVLTGGAVTATIAFSEDVIGMTIADLTIAGATAGPLVTVDARTYTIALTALGAGATTIDVDVSAAAAYTGRGDFSEAASGQAAIAYAAWSSATGADSDGVWADLSISGNGESPTQRFRLIPPGTFVMGSPTTEAGRVSLSETQHSVTITEPFWLADSACTQRMWKAVTGDTPSAFTADGLDLPVESVDRAEVQTFFTTLNGLKPDLMGRLPTESEWELAVRADTTTPFTIPLVNAASLNCTPDVDDPYIAGGLDRAKTVVVKSLPRNSWGLYEVHGNVFEFCSDGWVADWGSAARTDPVGAAGASGVVRGGAWNTAAANCRAASRFGAVMAYSANDTGFRMAATAAPSGGG
jgi:formylglycine-generating enzyme